MNRSYSKDLSLHLGWQDIRLSFVAEGAAWSPDVAQDMVNRMHEAWHNTLLELDRFGMLANGDEDDEDEFGPVQERELQTPYTIFIQDEGDNG